MSTNEILDAPEVDLNVVPGPGDCMPDVLTAGRVSRIVKINYYGGVIWDICDMDLAREALADLRLNKDIALAPAWMQIAGEVVTAQPPADVARAMVLSDGPEHARIRRIHARILGSRNTEAWQQRLDHLVTVLLDDLALKADDNGVVDLVTSYTHPIPRSSVCHLLGIPADWHDRMKDITDDIVYSPDPALRDRGIGLLATMAVEWADDPAQLNPGVITGLLDNIGTETGVTKEEVVTWTVGLLMAGYESTTSLIASAMLEALRRPADQRPQTEAQVGAWIEETLRIHPPFPHATWRFATEDVELGGYLIPQGAPVQINVAALNRCPRGQIEDTFNPDAGLEHLSFGVGRHYCMGTTLARSEAKAAINGFLSRYPNARLSEELPVTWESGWTARRVSTLPVVLDAD